ncbi:hypothetical protein M408DRAFT_57487, partial [Serendipita vermifera MAFF 305830]
RPDDAIKDINGGSDDVNKGIVGTSVWIVPYMSEAGSTGCTSFDLDIRSDKRSNAPDLDLAQGTYGDHRYLIPRINCNTNMKITDIHLMRSSNAVSNPPSGYAGMTGDINAGRSGDYLYVIWRTAEY